MESETLRRFVRDVREDLADALAKAWSGQGSGAPLLQWLTSREVLTAVEAESVLSAGQARRQALALLDLFVQRTDVRRVWTPFWNGVARFCPHECGPFFGLIEERLGVQALPAPKDVASMDNSRLGRRLSPGRTDGAGAARRPSRDASAHSCGAVDGHRTVAGTSRRGSEDVDLYAIVLRLSEERNALRAERAEALHENERLLTENYTFKEANSCLHEKLKKNEEALSVAEKSLATMEKAHSDAKNELERCKEQRKADLEQQQVTHKLLANMQVQCAQTLDQLKRNEELYEESQHSNRHLQSDLALAEQRYLEISRERDGLQEQLRSQVIDHVEENGSDVARELTAMAQKAATKRHISSVDSGVVVNTKLFETSKVTVQPLEVHVDLNFDLEAGLPGFRLGKGVFVDELEESILRSTGGQLAVGDRVLEINGVPCNKLEDLCDIIRNCNGHLQLVASRQVAVPGSVLAQAVSSDCWTGDASPSFNRSLGAFSFPTSSTVHCSGAPSPGPHLVSLSASLRSPSNQSLAGSSLHPSNAVDLIGADSSGDIAPGLDSEHPLGSHQLADNVPESTVLTVPNTSSEAGLELPAESKSAATGIGLEVDSHSAEPGRPSTGVRTVGAVSKEPAVIIVEDFSTPEHREQGSTTSMEGEASSNSLCLVQESDERTVEREVKTQVRLPRKRRQSVLTSSWRRELHLDPPADVRMDPCDGLKLRGGRGHGGTYVSAVPQWMAEEGLRVGDKFLFIQSVEVDNATYERVLFNIESSLGMYGGSVVIVVEHDLEGFEKIPESGRDDFFIRCLFNYTRCEPGEMPLVRGDILHVHNTLYNEDPKIWYATKVANFKDTSARAMIPSKNRAANLLGQRRNSAASIDAEGVVQFTESRRMRRPSSSSSSSKASLNCFGSLFRPKEPELPPPVTMPMKLEADLPQGYQFVELRKYDKLRPVVLVGLPSCVQKIINRLQREFKQRFQACPTENICTREKLVMDESIIKCVSSISNPSGYPCLTLRKICEVQKKNLHCLLDLPDVDAVQKIIDNDLHPIIITLQPKSMKKFRQFLTTFDGDVVSDGDAQLAFDQSLKIISNFLSMYSDQIDVGSQPDHVLQKIVEKVNYHQRIQEWVTVPE